MPKRGVVYLVGAGPGDPGLLTLRGAEILKRADVVLYDSLIGRGALRHARRGALKIDAGKRAAGLKGHPRQEEINRLTLSYAGQGRVVVRLKGGDPFLFGRGGEEAEFLMKYGLRVVVVPGVTSAIAVPESAWIPVTHRDLSSVFVAVTGHEGIEKRARPVDWAALARLDCTLVVLMGIGNIAGVVSRLVEGGKSPDTPAAVIEKGTTRGERVVMGTLSSIIGKVWRRGVQPPAIIVVGDAISMRRRLLRLKR